LFKGAVRKKDSWLATLFLYDAHASATSANS